MLISLQQDTKLALLITVLHVYFINNNWSLSDKVWPLQKYIFWQGMYAMLHWSQRFSWIICFLFPLTAERVSREKTSGHEHWEPHFHEASLSWRSASFNTSHHSEHIKPNCPITVKNYSLNFFNQIFNSFKKFFQSESEDQKLTLWTDFLNARDQRFSRCSPVCRFAVNGLTPTQQQTDNSRKPLGPG